MRPELKNIDWHVYGLSVSDYDYTIRLVQEIIEDRKKQLNARIEKAHLDYEGEIDIVEEIVSDISHYTYIDNLYLWQFALWRLQGIFEGILQQEFFPNKKLQGLKAKLDYVRSLKFTISPQALEWAKLRNALSHFPPEEYRPIGLEEEDIMEYFELLKLTCVKI